MAIKTAFLRKNKATQYSLLLVQPSLTSLDAGNSLRRVLGNFQDGTPLVTHSPDPLDFSRWRSSQIPHPGIAVDVKIPTHVRLTKSNSPGLPDPPILGQTIDRCTNKTTTTEKPTYVESTRSKELWSVNAAHVLNQRMAKSFCFRPLTTVLTWKSNAPSGGPHFGSNSSLYGAERESNARGLSGGRGGWAVLELTGTLLLAGWRISRLSVKWCTLGHMSQAPVLSWNMSNILFSSFFPRLRTTNFGRYIFGHFYRWFRASFATKMSDTLILLN